MLIFQLMSITNHHLLRNDTFYLNTRLIFSLILLILLSVGFQSSISCLHLLYLLWSCKWCSIVWINIWNLCLLRFFLQLSLAFLFQSFIFINPCFHFIYYTL